MATVLSELIEAIDEDKLITLASKTSKTYQLQRLGYIIEKIDTMDEDKKGRIIVKLEAYLAGKLKSYMPLASADSKNWISTMQKVENY